MIVECPEEKNCKKIFYLPYGIVCIPLFISHQPGKQKKTISNFRKFKTKHISEINANYYAEIQYHTSSGIYNRNGYFTSYDTILTNSLFLIHDMETQYGMKSM